MHPLGERLLLAQPQPQSQRQGGERGSPGAASQGSGERGGTEWKDGRGRGPG
jgi:hypothetical protein